MVSLTDRTIIRLKLDACETTDGFTDIHHGNYGGCEVNLTVGLVNNYVEKHCLKPCYSKCGLQASRTGIAREFVRNIECNSS